MDRQTNKRAMREQAQQGLNEVNNVVESAPQKAKTNPLAARAKNSQAKRSAEIEAGMQAGRVAEARSTFAGKQKVAKGEGITGHSTVVRGGQKQIKATNRMAEVAQQVALENIHAQKSEANEPVQRIKMGDTNPRLNISDAPKTTRYSKGGKLISRPIAAAKRRRSKGF